MTKEINAKEFKTINVLFRNNICFVFDDIIYHGCTKFIAISPW